MRLAISQQKINVRLGSGQEIRIKHQHGWPMIYHGQNERNHLYKTTLMFIKEILNLKRLTIDMIVVVNRALSPIFLSFFMRIQTPIAMMK